MKRINDFPKWNKLIVYFLVFGGLSVWLVPGWAGDSLARQRLLFEEAKTLLEQGKNKPYQALRERLAAYPIVHYLDYFFLMGQLETLPPEPIQRFLNNHAGSPPAEDLRRDWLALLAKREQWKLFLEVVQDREDRALRCHTVNARIQTAGEASGDELLAEAKNLWLVGFSQPKACDPVFAWLEAGGELSQDLRWERTRLAMRQGNVGLARYLGKNLPGPSRTWLEIWQGMYTDPSAQLADFNSPDLPLAREVLVDGLRRLARQDPIKARERWREFKQRYSLSEAQNAELARYLALWAADRDLFKEAAQWLAEIPADYLDDQARHTRLELTLMQRDWKGVLEQANNLPPAEAASDTWRYWQARALQQTGQQEQAEALYQELARERDYYGFLAAQRLGQAYQLNARPLEVASEALEKLQTRDDLQRARELFFVGLTDFARREWALMLDTLSGEELAAATRLAADWNWHDRAIVTAHRAGLHDALEVRFPTPFYDAVMRRTHEESLNYAWVYAIIRQESAFQVDARSASNALGLMQLLPGTAGDMAKRKRISLENAQDEEAAIFDPVTNIRLGSAYLTHLLDRFDGNLLLATAAYNAGPSRARRWASHFGCLPVDIWVEVIPFRQTREYVQRVISYTPIFEWRLSGHHPPSPMPLQALEGKCEGPYAGLAESD